ncbi:MAG TPA: hypothetical protein VK204_19960, partial [Nocardioidaceae bacterium]|nr:hypothetical protein [Nocardioidaceae bacterium]
DVGGEPEQQEDDTELEQERVHVRGSAEEDSTDTLDAAGGAHDDEGVPAEQHLVRRRRGDDVVAMHDGHDRCAGQRPAPGLPQRLTIEA